MNKKIIKYISFFLVVVSIQLIAQNKIDIIEGIVLDIDNKAPLTHAIIVSDISNKRIETDENGQFEIELDTTNLNLYFSNIGYRTKKINQNEIKNNYIIVYLSPLSTLLQEIAVYSNNADSYLHFDVNALSVKSNLVKKISNAMPDVFRALQAFPGISANNEFSAEFNVRGGNKDENLILLNGTQLFEPYHLRGAPNASVGVFNVDLIQDVNLITGGFSARYGDKLSSVANVKFREGNPDKYSGAFTLSLAFLDGYLEGPFFKNGSLILGVRKTYMEYLLDLTDFGYENIKTAKPSFYDIQGIFTYNLSSNNKINLSFIQSGDKLKYNPITNSNDNEYEDLFMEENALINTQSSYFEDLNGSYTSSVIDLNVLNILSKTAFIKTNISYSNQNDDESRIWGTKYLKQIYGDNEYFDNKVREDITSINSKNQALEVRSSLDYQTTPFLQNKIGFSYKYLTFKDLFHYSKNAMYTSNTLTYPDTLFEDYGYVGLDYRQDSLVFSSYKYAAYLESIFQISENLITNISGRIDYFDINKQLSISPRLNLAYSLNEGTTFRAAYGKFHQSPIVSQIAYSNPSDSNTKSQAAIHYILGFEQDISITEKSMNILKIKIDWFYKDYQNLISSFFAHSDRLAYSRKNDAIGYANGLELFLSLKYNNFYSWVSYSYLISKEDISNDDNGEYPRLTGQTHTLSWITDLNLGKDWSVNTKFFYGSGYPYAQKILEYLPETDEYFWRSNNINSKFLPPYSRLDLRLSKTFKFEKYTLNTFLEVSNMLNHKNIRAFDYSYDKNGIPQIYEITLWPILPSFGIRFQF